MLAALALFSCIGCSDGSATLAEPPGSIPALLGTIVECNVDVRSVSVVCRDPRASQGAASLALLGASQIKMRSANVVSDTARELFAMHATAQNLLGYAIGTPDGVTTTGLKIFFETGPTATGYYTPGDTGTVKVRNADGFQHFTGVQQPYYFYDTILPPQAITRSKRWEFHVPRTVMRFGFTVRVFTTTPRETRVGETPPDHTPPRYRDPSSSRVCNVSGLPECVFDAVMVRFRPGASREERQSAVDMVGRWRGGVRIWGSITCGLRGTPRSRGSAAHSAACDRFRRWSMRTPTESSPAPRSSCAQRWCQLERMAVGRQPCRRATLISGGDLRRVGVGV
jgi:hypothetical protein